ncbi:MAG: hypothetical protein ACNA8W_03635 [Bradymonadaceae bacterium]
MAVKQVEGDPMERLRAAIKEARRNELEPVREDTGRGIDPLERLDALIKGEVVEEVAARQAPVEEGRLRQDSLGQASVGQASVGQDGEPGIEALLGQEILALLTTRPLPGPTRVDLARGLAGALQKPTISPADLRELLAIVLGLDGG